MSPTVRQRNQSRRRLRTVLLVASAPVVALLLVVSFWLLGLSVTAGQAIAQYDDGAYVASAATSGSLLEQNHVEQWLPFFNRGSALTGENDFVSAIDDFEQALVRVPADHKCEVLINLSLAWEKLGDGYAQAGLYAGAALLYQHAADVLGQSCVAPQQPVDGRDLGQALGDATTRVNGKLGTADGLQKAQDDAGPTTGQDRLNQLEQQGQGAARQKADGDARDRSQQGASGSTSKPW
jgi:tetratricopeptide (TPR) repeat protein